MGVSAQTTTHGFGRMAPTEYDELIQRVHEAVESSVPSGTTVAVVSRGDEKLVHLEDRSGWHFPQNKSGRYAGYYPADSAEAITHLEELRSKGAQYFLIPGPALWWLDYYTELREHLEANYREVVHREDTCIVYQLDEDVGTEPASPRSGRFERPRSSRAAQLADLLDTLVPQGSVVAVVNTGESPLELHALQRRDFPAHGLPGGVSPADYLESIRRAGAEFLVIPHGAFEWLDTQPELKRKLAGERFITHQHHLCELYELRSPGVAGEGDPGAASAPAPEERRGQSRWTKFLSRITGKAG